MTTSPRLSGMKWQIRKEYFPMVCSHLAKQSLQRLRLSLLRKIVKFLTLEAAFRVNIRSPNQRRSTSLMSRVIMVTAVWNRRVALKTISAGQVCEEQLSMSKLSIRNSRNLIYQSEEAPKVSCSAQTWVQSFCLLIFSNSSLQLQTKRLRITIPVQRKPLLAIWAHAKALSNQWKERRVRYLKAARPIHMDSETGIARWNLTERIKRSLNKWRSLTSPRKWATALSQKV